MTIEDKAKLYDEALKKAKDVIEQNPLMEYLKKGIEYILPELKESEDERMIQYFKDLAPFDKADELYEKYGFSHKDAIAWLEKQGEQVSAIRWYDASFIPQEMKELLVEWNSSDATWHDVAFYHADTKTFLNYERELKNVTRWCYVDDLFEEQSNVKETGISQHDKKTCVEWSEEDVAAISCVISVVKWAAYSDHSHPILNDEGATELVERLKSLKDRVLPQPKQKWSEEDENLLKLSFENLTELKDRYGEEYGKVGDCISWLKSLKQRCTWKPSEEQLDALQYVYRNLNPPLSDKLGWNSLKTLELMYHDLKKLK